MGKNNRTPFLVPHAGALGPTFLLYANVIGIQSRFVSSPRDLRTSGGPNVVIRIQLTTALSEFVNKILGYNK